MYIPNETRNAKTDKNEKKMMRKKRENEDGTAYT